MKLVSILYLLLGSILVVSAGSTVGQELEEGFRHPPESARPWVYWFIMDGNFTREGITADLEAMKRAGIGGVILLEVNVGVPPGPVKFMSPQWRQLFKHAVSEAERLGIEITLNAGPGWTGSGGPWVKPEQSMQFVVSSSLEVVGPTHFQGKLAQAKPRAPYFQGPALPPELQKAKDAFYRDIAVLGFRSVPEPARIKDIDEKALYLRHPYSSHLQTKPFLPEPPDGAGVRMSAGAIDQDGIVDLTGKLKPDGVLDWNVPEGKWTILRFGTTSTGANTRPAPMPGLGLECDKLDKAALKAHFDAFIGTLLRELGPRKNRTGGWKMLHIDSWEMGPQNWSAHFREEFKRRRGYDLLPLLPVLTGAVVGNTAISERYLWDLRQTVQELILENHAEYLKALGRRHGFGLSIEPYDMTPCADLTLGSVADVPMCEFWLYGFNTSYSVFEAASIGHTCGRPIVAAEAFTSSDAERWQAYPGSMKALGDWALCSGVNRFVFHRYQHQPRLDQFPGMTMGPYGVHWERTQTFWDMVPAYHQYLARCQFLLRQGVSVADICYLVAEGAPHVFRPPPSAISGDPPDHLGYNFDGCAPETLVSRLSVEHGKLVSPDGPSYRVLVLPDQQTMTPGLLKKVQQLVRAGATVVGPQPTRSPSLAQYPGCDSEVTRIAKTVWGDCDGVAVKEHRYGKGRVLWDTAAVPAKQVSKPDPINEAKWIWHMEGRPAEPAPVGKRFFKRVVVLRPEATVESASISVTVDNAFELYVNGRPAGSGDNFHELSRFEIARLLRPGTNILAVAAENGGSEPNPAGLLAAASVQLSDGEMVRIVTDHEWRSATAAPSGWNTSPLTENWSAALELGPAGMAPWGQVEAATPEPNLYCDFRFVAKALERMGLPPDFRSDVRLRYAHRRTRNADIYFVANPEAQAVDANCTFRVSSCQPELWDPLTGARRDLPQFQTRNGGTAVPLRFEPHQSFFVVFRKKPGSPPASGINFPELRQFGRITGAWEVSFDPTWGGPAQITFQQLEDWSKRSEAGVRFYSGTAVYRKAFAAPPHPNRGRIYLDLGLVKNLARVKLNGRDLGVLWCAPWRVEVTEALKPGRNDLEITVANLWPNRLIGDQNRPVHERFTATTWNPFTPSSPLLQSGLLGPVVLLGDNAS